MLNGNLYSVCSARLSLAGYMFTCNLRSNPDDGNTVTSSHSQVSRDSSGFLSCTAMPPYDALLKRGQRAAIRSSTNSFVQKQAQENDKLNKTNLQNNRDDRDSPESVLLLETVDENCVKASLSQVVQVLTEHLFTSKDRLVTAGCVQGLCELSRCYPPVLYPEPWGAVPGPGGREPAVVGLLEQLLSVDGSGDLPLLADLLQLTCSLLSGVAVSNLQRLPQHQLPPASAAPAFSALGTPQCRVLAARVFTHTTRVLAIYSQVGAHYVC